MIVNVTLERIGTGGRGDRYRVIRDGLVIVESSRDPEHDTCRTLVALGVTGTLQTWRIGCPYPCVRLDIEKGAGHCVVENGRSGPSFRRHVSLSEARCCVQKSETAQEWHPREWNIFGSIRINFCQLSNEGEGWLRKSQLRR